MHHTHAAQGLLLQKHLAGGSGRIRAQVHSYTAGPGHRGCCAHSLPIPRATQVTDVRFPVRSPRPFCWKSSSLDFSAPGTTLRCVSVQTLQFPCSRPVTEEGEFKVQWIRMHRKLRSRKVLVAPVGVECGPSPLGETRRAEPLGKLLLPAGPQLRAWLLESDGAR